jgi:hypothetical protein
MSDLLSKRFESRPLRSTGVVNIATLHLIKIGFESGNESPPTLPNLLPETWINDVASP